MSVAATQKLNFNKEQKRRRDSPALMISDFRPLLRKAAWSHQRCGMGLQLPMSWLLCFNRTGDTKKILQMWPFWTTSGVNLLKRGVSFSFLWSVLLGALTRLDIFPKESCSVNARTCWERFWIPRKALGRQSFPCLPGTSFGAGDAGQGECQAPPRMLRGCQIEVGAEELRQLAQLDPVFSLECVGSRSGTEETAEGTGFFLF